ncbi:MAG: hypothetical protein K0R24_2358, partial [Gammaproteobacteria bacterium]|nr:hypothetical protein [Gammaproteobacteria bacterium]
MNYDIAIIGNGIISYVTAYSLLQEDPGLKIAIIGKKNRYGSGTIAAGAMLNVFAEVTNRTLSSAAAKTKFEMAIQASKLWKNWINELNENFPLHKKLKIDQGTFVILNARSGRLDCENYQAIIDTLKFYQEPYTEIKASDIPGLNSLEDARPLNSLYIPNEGCISSLEMLEALENILSSYHNVMLVDDVATEIQYISGATNGVKTLNKGVFSTRQVILAAGVYSQQLIDQIPEIKDNIPRILSGVGYSLLIKEHSTPIQHAIRTPNRAGACGLHALPRGDSTLYIGATNNIQVDPQLVPTAGLIKFLLICAIEQIDQDIYKSQLFGWHV